LGALIRIARASLRLGSHPALAQRLVGQIVAVLYRRTRPSTVADAADGGALILKHTSNASVARSFSSTAWFLIAPG
jgi:hypothetical protein